MAPDASSALSATGDNAPDSRAPINTTLTRESGETVPVLSQASEYSVAFDNKPNFWSDVADLDPTQVDTPPTSLSSGPTSGSGSRLASSSSSVTSVSTGGSKQSKRKPSLTSIEHDEWARVPKKRRSVQDYPFVNLSPTHNIQRGIDYRGLPYSVQWELARIVSKGHRNWEGEDKRTITFENLDRLRPSGDPTKKHSEGTRKILEMFSSGENDGSSLSNRSKAERIATDPWSELEKEDQFEANDPYFEKINESGGKIHFTGTLKISTDRKHLTTPDFRVELNPAELGPSCNFARSFGSKSFFRLKVPKFLTTGASNACRLDFLYKPIILCKRVFRAFYAKEETVFYFRTNDTWNAMTEDISPSLPGAPGLSLEQFLDRVNPIELNQKQTMAKWAARLALGLSSSIHGTTLSRESIEIVDDTTSEQGSVMTDGAGSISRSLLQELSFKHDWSTRPSAIQIRVRGSKGLLVEHPIMKDDKAVIQLRKSLVKIQYNEPLDIIQRSLDIVRTAHSKSPIRVSSDIIINLSANGVSYKVLKNLITETVEAAVRPLSNWDLDDVHSLRELWLSFEHSGSVISSRRAREEVTLARVNGYTERDTSEDVQEDDEEAQELEDATERSAEWWPDSVSGCPSSLEETIMEFLDSGFHPSSCTILREKMFSVVQKTVTHLIENSVIVIKQSASAWIVPDPLGILEENEIFFRSSHANLAAPDGTETDIITGDILITRDPCRLPTDVQKWKAVDVLPLHYLKDVIVLSVKGPRRAADWLAGGDYDGDRAKIIWQPDLVQEFKNADKSFADPPPDLDTYFETNNELVGDFLDRVRPLPSDQRLKETQKYLLGMMKDQGVVGRYSNFHEYSTCVNGYGDKETKRLAYIFTTALDGRKTGKSVRGDTLKKDQREFGQKQLGWKATLQRKQGEFAPDTNINPTRQPGFIMEKLAKHGKELEKMHLAKMEQQKKSFKHENDPVLLKPMLEIQEKIEKLRLKGNDSAANCLAHDYKLIQVHVEAMYHQHHEDMQKTRPTTYAGTTFTNLPIQIRQDILRKSSRNFHARPLTDEFQILTTDAADRIKASYTYYYDSKQAQVPSRFPWNVAFRVLCCIKAGEEVKPVHRSFYDHMVIKRSRNAKHHR